MKQDTKRTLILCTLLVFYIIVAITGVYNIGSGLMLSILGIPFALHIVKNEYKVSIHVLYNLAICLSIYALTGGIEGTFAYIVNISVPAYAIAYFYRNKYPLPSIVIYVAIINACAALIYQVVMKTSGINYELQYMLYTEELKTIFIPNFVHQFASISGNLEPSLEVQLTQVLISSFELVKQLFAALLVMNTFICTVVQVLIIHGILRHKDKKLSKFGELLEFRLSKIVVVFLLVAIMTISMATDALSGTVILGVNIIVVTYMLFMIVGLLGMIGLVKKAVVSKKVKVMSAIFLGVVILMSPTLLILFGFLDTFLNFRKVTLVV